MRIIEVRDQRVLSDGPTDTSVIIKQGQIKQDEFIITRIELRHYIDSNSNSNKTQQHNKPGYDLRQKTYSVITAYVETNKGSVEMTYDEGFLGNSPLTTASKLLTENIGLSALVLRCVIAIKSKL